jgi:hypothetical protein
MFELEGVQYSVEDLQAAAKKYEMEYDAYLKVMEGQGLKKVETTDVVENKIETKDGCGCSANKKYNTSRYGIRLGRYFFGLTKG